MVRRLTLIAGSGSIVPHVAAAAKQHGDLLQVLLLSPHVDIAGDVVHAAQLSDTTAMLTAIRAFGTTHVVLAGGVRLTDADREGLARAMGPVGRIARSLGDVGLAVGGLLYSRLVGVKLIGAHQVAPDLLAHDGHIAGPALDAAQRDFARQALRAARAIGRLDLGQAVVASGGRVIAAEDVEGTSALLARVRDLRARGFVAGGKVPLILAKALKPRQPTYVDLPAIGPATLAEAVAAGIDIIVVEARRALLLERPILEAEAKTLGISVLGLALGRG